MIDARSGIASEFLPIFRITHSLAGALLGPCHARIGNVLMLCMAQ
jgi:hypothetical protein